MRTKLYIPPVVIPRRQDNPDNPDFEEEYIDDTEQYTYTEHSEGAKLYGKFLLSSGIILVVVMLGYLIYTAIKRK